MKECPPVYKNLGLMSFDEQREVTIEMLRQICKNDEWLKQNLEKIEYLTPPAIRKRFTPVPVDTNKSYGYKITTDNNVVFDSGTNKEVFLDFDDTSLIDINKTTAVIEGLIDNGKIIHQVKIPQETTSNIDKSTRNYSPWAIKDSNGNIIGGDMVANEHWYIGFDKNRHYETRPQWLENQLNNEIPSIGRAQTFKAKKTGLLESIVLNIKASAGEDKYNTASPLIVQIRKTIDKDGVLYPEELACDYDGKYTVLAQQEVRFHNSSPDIASILFDHPCTVKKGETYAIVLLSPLSHYSHCYWLGGWNKHCHADNYADGNAFYTFNNGMTWIRYGKDDDVEYHQGKYAPQDFAFQAHIREFKTGYPVNKDYWLYLKPIFANQIESILLSATDTGDATQPDLTCEYQVSNNGRDWKPIGINHQLDFNTKDLRNVVFLRARLQTKKTGETPLIENLNLLLTCDIPTEMYVRTHHYYPKTAPMLGANVWGRVNAPFAVEPTVTCNVDIIRDKEVTEHYIIIEPSQVQEFTSLEGIPEEKFKDADNEKAYNYLTENPSIITILKEHQVYVKGYTDKTGTNQPPLFTKIKFISSPSYPLINCSLQPRTGSTQVFSEFIDYHVDYDNDELIFYNEVLNSLPVGTLNVTYNPLFIRNLSNEEMPLILDYFQEIVQVGEKEIETHRIPLRTAPADPIRKVVLNPDTDNKELVEDVDYTVNYDTQELCFDIINNDDKSSLLSLNDKLSIVYTPNLDDSGISLGYYATRENIRKQCYIKPNYIEYKT